MSSAATPWRRTAWITSFIRFALSRIAASAVRASVRTPSVTVASSGSERIIAVPETVTVRFMVPGSGADVCASDGSVSATATPSATPASPHFAFPFIVGHLQVQGPRLGRSFGAGRFPRTLRRGAVAQPGQSRGLLTLVSRVRILPAPRVPEGSPERKPARGRDAASRGWAGPGARHRGDGMSTQDHRRGRLRALLRHRDFRLLLAAQTLTMFGDVALVLVLGIWVKDLTDSNGAAGAVFLVYSVPAVVAPLAGPLIDRFPPRRIMIVNDLVTMGVALSLLLVQGKGDAWIIYIVAFLYGGVQIVFFAARSGLLVSILPADQLQEANGLLESLPPNLPILPPLVGAGLFALWGGGAVAVLDASVFAVSAGILTLIHPRAPDPPAHEGSMRGELTAGVRPIPRTLAPRRAAFYT